MLKGERGSEGVNTGTLMGVLRDFSQLIFMFICMYTHIYVRTTALNLRPVQLAEWLSARHECTAYITPMYQKKAELNACNARYHALGTSHAGVLVEFQVARFCEKRQKCMEFQSIAL